MNTLHTTSISTLHYTNHIMTYFSIFQLLNNSVIFNTAITMMLASLLLLLFTSFVIEGVSKECKRYKAHQQMLWDVANNRFTKKELIRIARNNNIRYSKLNKRQLQTRLIEVL